MLLPFGAFVLAIVLAWGSLVTAEALAIAAIMYVITGLDHGGFHRLLAHRAFVARPAARLALAGRDDGDDGGPVRW